MIVLSGSMLITPLPTTEAATQIGFVVYWAAFDFEHRMAAAAPSPMGAHIIRVSG